MFDTLVTSIGGLRALANDPVAVIAELLLIGLSVNWCASVLHGTRGTRPLRGILTVLVVVTLLVNALASQFDWQRLALLYRYFVIGLAFVALVAFQPELRRAVIRAGDVRFLRRGTPQSRGIRALVQSARYLSRNRYGGLIALQRAVDLSGWAEKGTLLNANVSANMLNTIFFPNSPLHDLGVIIAGKRILAANCQFPLAESDEVESAVGSRHLAAVGMSYETDALVLIISEETGTISLADNGKLIRFMSLDDLADELTARLSGKPVKSNGKDKQQLPPLSYAWRLIRRLLVVLPLTLAIWLLANQASQTEIAGVDVQLVPRIKAPDRWVDIELPRQARFKVKFQGSARAIERLRGKTSDQPLSVDWELPDHYLAGSKLRTESALELLNNLPKIRRRGISVLEVEPQGIQFIVDELVTVAMGVTADTGDTQVVDERFIPDQVQVTLRKRHLDLLPENQWFVSLALEELLRGTGPEQTFAQRIPLPRRVGRFAAVNVEPSEVNVSLRVVGQRIRKSLSAIPVWLLVSPELQERYEVERLDPQEWLIEVEVEGEQSTVNSLQTQDILAYVPVSSDLLSLTPESRARVEFHAPVGITILSERTVQLRLLRRDERTP